MSYILEALKRSQEEHSRGQVPTLATEVPSKPLRRSWWKILVLGVLVIGAGGVLVAAYERFLQPPEVTTTPPKESPQSSTVASEPGQAGAGLASTKTETPPSAETPQAKPERPRNRFATEPKTSGEGGGAKPARRASAETNPAEGQIMQSLRAETESLQENLRRMVSEAQSHLPPQATPAPEPKKKIPIFGEKPPAPSLPAAAPRPVVTPVPQPGTAPVADAATEEDKSALPPLPPEVEAALPQIRLLAHVYRGEAEKRFVILNGQKLGEGQTTRDGLLVESIQQDGVRLGFRGHSLYRNR